jgi:hypothetical protein
MIAQGAEDTTRPQAETYTPFTKAPRRELRHDNAQAAAPVPPLPFAGVPVGPSRACSTGGDLAHQARREPVEAAAAGDEHLRYDAEGLDPGGFGLTGEAA